MSPSRPAIVLPSRGMRPELLAKHFAYLAPSAKNRPLVDAVFGSATGVVEDGEKMIVEFPGGKELVAFPPAKGTYRGWPEEFQRLLKKHEALHFPDDSGWALILNGGELDFAVAGTKTPKAALQDYSDWWIYRGAKLSFFSHESSKFEGEAACGPGELFLRRMAEILEIDLKKPAPLKKVVNAGAGLRELGVYQLDLGGPFSVDEVVFKAPDILFVLTCQMNEDSSKLLSFEFGDDLGDRKALSKIPLKWRGEPQLSEDGRALWVGSKTGFDRIDVSNPNRLKSTLSVHDRLRHAWDADKRGGSVFLDDRVIFRRNESGMGGDEVAGYAIQLAQKGAKPRVFAESEPGYCFPANHGVRLGRRVVFCGGAASWALDVPKSGDPTIAWKLSYRTAGGSIFNHLLALPGDQVAISSGADHAVAIVDVFPQGTIRGEFYRARKVLVWHRFGDRLWMALEDENEEVSLGALQWGKDGTIRELPTSPLKVPGRRPAGLVVRSSCIDVLTSGAEVHRFARPD